MTVYVVMDCNDMVVGIFDSIKLAEKAKKEFDERFDGDCPYCDEWDSHIEKFKLNFMYDMYGDADAVEMMTDDYNRN